ncbi:1,4-alpha-glucan branching protein domain-containing protein [Brevibacillus sp. H7]|uniref:1,4-alpha-glucan branching protein domain-containing protein n=1 Tax=Brevibacillus sp. H7 TaxID=3349138 RepID=UPI0038087CA7
MQKGYLSLVLHAHLPYVRHEDRDDYLEERWVYEAMLEAYIPLLLVFERLKLDGIDFRITLAVSPTLLSMLADPLIQNRFKTHLAKTVELAGKEVKRTAGKPQEHRVARMYLDRLREIASYLSRLNGNLVPALRHLQEGGHVELITCAATHAFLPLVETEEAIRAQLLVGMDTHERILGQRPLGIWLPECAYTPGLDRLLKDCGLRYFFVDSHTFEHATPEPRRGLYAPLFTPYDVAAFARDAESCRQVWSSAEGYPGDFDYREYYRDIGFDLEETYISPYIHPSGIRVHTGLKYHRITGKDVPKEIYNPDRAREKAAIHAGHFMFNRERQVERAADWLDRKPLVVATYDAELFGHWWYEGPQFLDFLLRKVTGDSEVLKLITPSEYLAEFEQNDRARLPMSSWGRNGYAEVWLNERNDWIYRHLHQAERELIEAVEILDTADDPLEKRALRQAARELMLAQSSDWAFIMDNQTMVDYAVRRTHDHLVRFRDILIRFEAGSLEENFISALERAYPIFPDLDLAYYLPKRAHRVNLSRNLVAAGQAEFPQLRVLMLSWEFPPQVVGGLSKAVYDLSRHLVRQNVEVHVLTGYAHGAPEREVVEGIHVYRLCTYQPGNQTDFLDWVFQLNMAMLDELDHLMRLGFEPDVIHAHDWLVGFAAMEAKRRYQLPLATTIHALEHGRNQGIHTPLQQRIHQLEGDLIAMSDHVFVCSRYMADELRRLFGFPVERTLIVPNGMELPDWNTAEEEKNLRRLREQIGADSGRVVFFVGRMVREKGVQLLLEAAPHILQRHGDVTFVLAGRGPMLEELGRQAQELGIADRTRFLGFVDDERRNQLFRLADVAVFPSLYEPFGIVALEAMAFGTPLLVADTGGLREIVRHTENGATMYAGDVQSLINQLCWLLEHPEQCRSMAERARQEIEQYYNWAHLASQSITAYRSLGQQRLSAMNKGGTW